MEWKAQSLGEVLERQARGRGTIEALVTPTRRVTYEDLYLRARSAATTLHTLGVGRGDHVGILMGNDEKWLAPFYGPALIGAGTVPVKTRFQLPAVLPRRGLYALGADGARRGRDARHAADVRSRRGARDARARALHAHLRQRHDLP